MRAFLILIALLAATLPSATDAREPSPWDDWTETDRASVGYRLKPSFPEQGPWILVRFYVERPQPDGRRGWRAQRLAFDVWSGADGRDGPTVASVASSLDCPAIREVAESVGRAVGAPIEADRTKGGVPAYMADGVSVTVFADVVERDSRAPITVTVSGNLNSAAGAWAHDAEAALKDCWKRA